MQIELWTISGPGFHFGRHGLGQEESGVHLTSDSLFAALVARLAMLEGPQDVQNWIEYFNVDPPAFVLSSAYPRAGSVYFFPVPMGSSHSKPGEGQIKHKELKKVRFVSEQIFRNLLTSGSLASSYPSALKLQGGELLVSPAEIDRLPEGVRLGNHPVWKIEQRPRVALGREQVNSNLYHTGRNAFAPGCGLWFGLRWFLAKAELKPLLQRLLDDLGDAGLGGERSSGMGAANIEPAGTLELPDPAGGPWLTLSHYLPHPSDGPAMLDDRAAYLLERVGGWVESPGQKAERRRSVNMLVEGSLLGPVARPAPGQMVDLQPDYGGTRPLGHPVWRNGMALAVGFQTGAGEGS